MKHTTGHLDNRKINNKQLTNIRVCRFCSTESAWAAHKETKAGPSNSSIQGMFELKKIIKVTAVGVLIWGTRSLKLYMYSKNYGKGCTHFENQDLIWHKIIRCEISHGSPPTTEYLTLFWLALWVVRYSPQYMAPLGSATSNMSKRDVGYTCSCLQGVKSPLKTSLFQSKHFLSCPLRKNYCHNAVNCNLQALLCQHLSLFQLIWNRIQLSSPPMS